MNLIMDQSLSKKYVRYNLGTHLGSTTPRTVAAISPPSHVLCTAISNPHPGRTHQIRVHMAHLRHPLIGDPVYGARLQLPKNADDYVKEVMRGFKRQALHAKRLSFLHPESGKELNFEVPMPDDMAVLIEALRDHHFGDSEEMEFGDDFYQAFEVDGLEIWEEDD